MKDSSTISANVHYHYTELVPTLYPGLEIEIRYTGQAYVNGDEVTLFDPLRISIGHTPYMVKALPSSNTPEGRRLIAILKTAALQAAWQRANDQEFGPSFAETFGRPEKGFIE